MFKKLLYRLLSTILVLVLLAQMLPAEVLAAEVAAVGDAGNESMVTDFAAAQPEVARRGTVLCLEPKSCGNIRKCN